MATFQDYNAGSASSKAANKASARAKSGSYSAHLAAEAMHRAAASVNSKYPTLAADHLKKAEFHAAALTHHPAKAGDGLHNAHPVHQAAAMTGPKGGRYTVGPSGTKVYEHK